MKDLTKLVGFKQIDRVPYDDYYDEVDQSSDLRWVPALVDWTKETITFNFKPMQCREFLADLQFCELGGLEGEVYGADFVIPSSGTYLDVLMVMSRESHEQDTLKKLGGYLVPSPIEFPYDASDTVREKCPGLWAFEIPEWARCSPLGLSLWTFGLRACVETGSLPREDSLFGFSPAVLEEASGNCAKIWEQLAPYTDILTILNEKRDLFVSVVDILSEVEKYEVDYDTHEHLSPVNLLYPFSNRSYTGDLLGRTEDQLAYPQQKVIWDRVS